MKIMDNASQPANLHPILLRDCFVIGKLPLSYILLMNDAQYPWCILVPDLENITEIYQMSVQDQQQLLAESSLLGESMMQTFAGDKLNIGALGNVVSQLHLHHIVRFRDDPAWPGPVWGCVPARPYSDENRLQATELIVKAMKEKIELVL